MILGEAGTRQRHHPPWRQPAGGLADQLRDAIDLTPRWKTSISPGSEWIEINGQRKNTCAATWATFCSRPPAHSPGDQLSGGERNRLLLARLFARPATVLVLDEPPTTWTSKPSTCLEELLRTTRHRVPRQPRPYLSGQRGHQHHCPTKATVCGANLKAAWKTGCSNQQRSQALRDQRNNRPQPMAAPAAEAKQGGNAAAPDNKPPPPRKS